MGPHRPSPRNLAEAIQRGNSSEVICLIRAGADVNRQFGYFGMHAHPEKGEEWMEEIRHYQDTLTRVGQAGQYPLGWSLVHGHLHIATLLLDFGAHLHARDNSGKSARDYAENPEVFTEFARLRKLLRPFTLFYCKFYEEGEVPLDIIRLILFEYVLVSRNSVGSSPSP